MDDDVPVKPGRGRPRGTGKPDDGALRTIADFLVADATLRPTTAIKRIVASQNPSTIRRLQVKWKARGSAFLREARRRREQQVACAAAGAPVRMSVAADAAVWGRLAQLAELCKPSPAIQAALDAMKPSPAIQAALDALKPSPAMQAALDAMKPSPAIQAALDTLKPSPAIQAALDEANRWRKQFEQVTMFEPLTRREIFIF
jgi:hypothetical protein